MSEQQSLPIPTFVSSPKGGNFVPPVQQSPHHTSRKQSRHAKAEKRAYARQQQAAQGSNSSSKHVRRANIIGYAQYSHANLTIEQIDDQISLLMQLRRLKTQSSLESRITRDEAPKPKKEKKELTRQKLEKIQKRREQRAAKKAAWLAKKSAEGDGAVASEPSGVPPVPVVTRGSITEDNINWDEL